MPVLVFVLNNSSWKLVILLLILPLFVRIPLLDTMMFYLLPTISHKRIVLLKDLLAKVWVKILVLLLGIVCINVRNEVELLPQLIERYDAVFSYIQAIGATLIVVSIYLLPTTIEFIYNSVGEILIKMADYTYEFYLTHFIILLSLRPFVSNYLQIILYSMLISIAIAVVIKAFCSLRLSKKII